jgi:hypothetical protein
MDAQPAWERELDALVRPAFVVEPPADLQQSILAAVLQATVEVPRPVVLPVMPVAASAEGRPVSLVAYLLLAAVLIAYAAILPWLHSFVGGGSWVPTLVSQLVTASDLIFGRLPTGEPLELIWLVLQRAPWLALLPLAWLLWERDRASAQVA